MLMAVFGCRRKSPALPPVPAAEEAPVAAAKAPSASSPATPHSPAGKAEQPPADRLPTAPPNSSIRLPIHQELTGAVHLYQTDHQKLPPDFETLVKEKYLKAMPKPPPGKRFAVDRNRLQVVITD